jgi:putative redox protein
MTTITAQLSSGTMVRLYNGRHEWTADEAPDAGGTDQGPNPYDLLLGSLAACTCITLALYCTYKGIALESVSATFAYERVHREDCEDCDDPTKGFIDRITSDVALQGDFTGAQRERLAQVATRCPVHKTLVNGMVIEEGVRFV